MATKSIKTQFYEQLAQQAVEKIGMQQFEQAYNQWNAEQDGLAQFQAAYDEWNKANPIQTPEPQPVETVQQAQPVQKAPVQKEPEIPVLKSEEMKPFMEDYQRQQQLEQMAAERHSTGKGSKEWKQSVNDTLNILNSKDTRDLNKAMKVVEKAKRVEEANKPMGSGIKQVSNLSDYAKALSGTDSGLSETDKDYSKAMQWTDPNYRMTKDEQKEARRIASEGLNELSAKYPVTDKADFGKLYERMSPEDQAKYRTYEDLDDKANNVFAMSVGAADKAVDMLGGALDTYAFFQPGARDLAKKYKGVKEAWDTASEPAVDIAKQATPIAENVPVIGEVTPYGVGQTATQLGAYLLTNDVFDSIGTAVGGKLGGFAANQIGQNLQDIPLDTVPLLQELAKDGELSAEDWKEVGANVRNNAIGNLVMGGLSEIPALSKWIQGKSAAKKAANEATQASIREGAEKLAKLANMEDVDNLVKTATSQAETAAKNIEDISKQIPEVPAEDVKLSKPRPGGDMPIDPAVKAQANDFQKWIDQQEEVLKTQPEYSEDVQEKLFSDFEEIYRSLDNMGNAAEASGSAKAIEKYKKLQNAVSSYEDTLWKTEDVDELNKDRKAADAARQSFIREMKKGDPNYKGDLTGTKLGNAQYRLPDTTAEKQVEEMVNDWAKQDIENPNRFVADAEPETQNVFRGVNDNVPGANQLQTFAGGTPKDEWATSKYRTNTIENMGWGDQSPIEDYAYRRFKTAEQHEVAAQRNQSFDDLVHKDSFDAPDIKASMEMQKGLLDSENYKDYRRLSRKTRFEVTDKGQTIQALAEYNKNTAVGALQDAQKVQDDILEPWRSKNVKKREGNSRIAKALADMGHNEKKALAPELTHDQIKQGVIAELEREVGSVEKIFNDNDIEFLTQLAEDRSIPVWKITSEIEHKLQTGNWYTLDESIEIPKPTNAKLQSALNSLVEETIRTEKEAPTLKEITEQVRNTLEKESYGSKFSDLTDDDIDYLANLIHEGASKEELADALDMRAATGGWGISDETLREVNNIFKQISHYDVNSKQFVEGQARAYELLADELLPNATFREKFEAWRYLAMLGNPKTMLRNLIGNTTFNVVTGTSNSLAAVMEAGIDKGIRALGGNGIQRTKALLNPVTDSGLIKAAWEDADASSFRQINGSKYEKMDANALRQAKSVFNSKLAQFYEKVTDAGISDYHAVKTKYSTSLAGYMKANGMDTSIFKAEDELRRLKELSNTKLLSDAEKAQIDSLQKQVADLDKAREFALKQAEYATFHEDNKIANVISSWSRISKEKGLGIGHVLLEGMIPFKKTPANVLRSGLEYSPLGAIKSIKETGKLIYENTGKRAGNLADTYVNKRGKEVARTFASDVIDSWSKTLTGTGLTALGFYLYDKGILNSSDKDLKYQDQLEGKQNYSITINGKTYTIDWAAPTVMPLLLGAEIAKVWNNSGQDVEKWYEHLDEYVNAANRIADPIIETSMLQGVKDTLETAANAAKYNENLNIPTLIGYNLATGYATQAVPTLGGQIARTVDPTRRSTYTQTDGVAGTLEKQGRKLMNKIPGLSYLNQPYLDNYGREQKNSPFNNPAGNLAYQMLSPGYLADINETSADKISREVYDINKDTRALPEFKSTFKVDGKKVSPEDYTKGAKIYGEAQKDMRTRLANSNTFKNLEPEQKEEFLRKVNTLAEKKAMERLDPDFSPSEDYKTYKKSGIDGLLNEYKHNADYTKAVEEAGIDKSSGAKKAFEDGGAKAVLKYADQQKALDKYGLKEKDFAKDVYEKSGEAGLKDYKVFSSYDEGTDAYKRYEKAKASNSTLTASDYNSTLMKIDGLGDKGKKNGSITQDEMISYLNKINASQKEADRLWKTYGKFYAEEGNWAKIPVLEGGTWKAKKAK